MMLIIFFRHTCVLPNHQFYFYILTVSSALLCIYILCNIYNLVSLDFGPFKTLKVTLDYLDLHLIKIGIKLISWWITKYWKSFWKTFIDIFVLQCWIIWPQMGLMFRVIRKYREELDTPNYNLDPKKPFISTENFLNVYFDR